MGATLNDVARAAGVSPTTVSLVLRGKAGSRVSEETARRIREATEELHYVPNRMAQGLATRRSGMIGLWVPFRGPLLLNFFLVQLLAGVQQTAREQGFDLILYSEPHETGLRDDFVPARRMVGSGAIDGLLMVGTRHTTSRGIRSTVSRLSGMGLPFVIANHWPPLTAECSCVGLDQTARIRQALEHLVGLGHQHILLLGGDPASSSGEWARDRFRELARTLTTDPDWYDAQGARWFLVGGYDETSAYSVTLDRLRAGFQATAMLALSDEMAIGALRALKEAGLRVPEDVSMVGNDDIVLAAYVEPPLTTLRSPAFQMGVTATELLLRQVEGDRTAQQVVLHSELVVRASTGPCPARTV